MKYDHTEYNGGAPSNVIPDRLSTPTELTIWMNKLSASIGSGVHHWITEGVVHFLRVDINGKLVEWGVL